jgi:hypothetical protein
MAATGLSAEKNCDRPFPDLLNPAVADLIIFHRTPIRVRLDMESAGSAFPARLMPMSLQ